MKYTLMNVPMTIAIQDGRKTNTRRCIKNTKYADFSSMKIDEKVYPKGRLIHYKYMGKNCSMFSDDFIKQYAKYQIGETIWVREPARVVSVHGFKMDIEYLADKYRTTIDIPKGFYKTQPASSIINYAKWISLRQGIPNGCIKEMARIFLKVTNIRVEKLQDMASRPDSYDEVCREGLPLNFYDNGGQNFWHWWINLWNKTAPKGYRWEDNPYVFVYEFERVDNENKK